MRRRWIALLALWPFAALADETVEAKDGRRLLLRDDGTYQVLARPGAGCEALETHQEIDHRIRRAAKAVDDLARSRRLVCAVVDARLSFAQADTAEYVFANADRPGSGNDGEIELREVTKADRGHLLEHCLKTYCRAVVYGRVIGRTSGPYISPTRIEFPR